MYISTTKKIKVGVFVFSAILIVAMTVFVIVGFRIQDDTKKFYIVFRDESVSGLTVGSNIKYQGVQIGKIDDIRISGVDFTTIRVDVSISNEMIVKEDMFATLHMAGITGMKYIELSGGSVESKTIAEGGRIASRPSQFASIANNMDEIAFRATDLLYNLSDVTNEKNREKITQSLNNIEIITSEVNSFSREVKPLVLESVTSLNRSIEDIQNFFEAVTPMMEDVQKVTQKLSSDLFLNNIDSLVITTNSVIAQTDSALQVITTFVNNSNMIFAERKDDFVGIVISLEQITRNLEVFSKEVKDNPSVLIRGRKVKER